MLLPILEVVVRRALAVTAVVAPPAQLVAPGTQFDEACPTPELPVTNMGVNYELYFVGLLKNLN